ncbi:MAG TPA: sensor histidine kinase [Chloroflexota bacterium]|nr:sensor histidine kinase [Chloroflexota bacterium]
MYVTVLVAGIYSEIAGLCAVNPPRTAGFVATLAGLLALETVERRWFPMRRGVAVALLALRAGAFALVAVLDCSGTARSLFLLLPFLAFFTLGRRAGIGLAVACLAVVVAALAREPGWYEDREAISDLLMFCVGLVFAVAMAVVAHREELGRARAERLAERVAELAAVAERYRLARDIHDNVGHHLTVISVQLEKAAAFRDIDAAAADQALADARESARSALQEVRRSVGALRAQGEPFSLTAALASLVERLRDGGPRVELEVSGGEPALGDAALLAVYHAAQESLTNACRHADAGLVTVRAALGERDAQVTVTDDGRGFVPYDGQGFGLRGMRERLELVGGKLHIESAPGRGTRVTASVDGDMR